VSLMGRSAQLPDSELAAFSDFVLPLVYPPNPNQNLDRTFRDPPTGPSAFRGLQFFLYTPVAGSLVCADCHAMPSGTNGQVIDHVALREAQDMKVPQLRNLYIKSGFTDAPGAVNKRGFGYTHDGSIDHLFAFLQFPGFDFGSPQSVADAHRRDVEQFLLEFDTGMAPAVGYQVTFNATNHADPTVTSRLDTLEHQLMKGNCELVAKGRVGTTPRGWVSQSIGFWQSDRGTETPITTAQLIAFATSGHELTITGVPIGSGIRIGIDRDRDGALDADELAAGTDPGDPSSMPPVAVDRPGAPGPGLHAVRPNPFQSRAAIEYVLSRDDEVTIAVYDVLGREVRAIARRQRATAGPHVVTWDGRANDGHAVANGMYFVRLQSGEESWQRPVLRVR